MSQLLLRRFSAHPRCAGRGHYRCLGWAAGGGPHYGGERRRGLQQHDEENRAVKVSVWWDFENCNLPSGVNVCRVAPRVAAALRAAGIRGPLSITAFGDVLQLARASQDALVATGISISHVPHSGKNSSDRLFMADLVYWIAQNPPPVHFFLISGDRDFTTILHRLRMSNYNVLLACPSSATSVLCSAATIMWPWEALVKGDDFSPKHFNHPPDGLSGSWYGHYKVALDDPFLDTESDKPIAVPSDSKDCPKPIAVPSDSKRNPIPKYAVNGIREALSSYPHGVSLSLLRSELQKNNVYLGKDFFGRNKFSCLLQSMPDIVEFINPPPGEDQLYVVGVNKRLPVPAEQSLKTLSSAHSNVRDNNFTRTTPNDKIPPSSVSTSFPEQASKILNSSQSIVGDRSFMQTVDENPPTFSVSSSPTADLNAEPESCANHKEVDARNAPGTPSSSGVENTVNKDGIFKRIWILWNGSETAKPEVSPHRESTSAEEVDDLRTPQQDHIADQHRKLLKRTHETSSRNGSSDLTDSAVIANFSTLSEDDRSEKLKHGEEMGTLKSDPSVFQNSEPCSGPASVPMGKAGKMDDTSKMSRGLFSWVMGWWKFVKSDNSTTNQNVIDVARTNSIEESESLSASTCGNEQQVVHEIFTKSYLWEVLEQQLSKPLGSELVSKAKTREELGHELQKLDCWPLKGLVEKDLGQLVHLLVSEKKWIEETPSRYFPFRLTLPHKRTCVPSKSSKFDGLSSLFTGKPLQQGKYVSDKSRADRSLNREKILSDCRMLLKELLLQYQYGFNISIFKRQFAQKHGYELDHQKLGYPDLKSLLQIMPGVRIKFPRVLTAENGDGHAGNKRDQCNGDDCTWEELGPVSATAETAEEVDKEMCYRPPTLSDDEFSDDDNHADQQPRRDAEQNTLLQIIDSWKSSKDDGSSKKLQDIDGLVDCSRSNPGYLDNLIEGKSQKPTRVSHKHYCFVSDSEEDEEKDKLVESVLGTLQKARGPKFHN